MNRQRSKRWLRGTLALLTGGLGLVAAMSSPAGADTTLNGEGGTFLQPVLTKLTVNSKSNLNPVLGAYIATGLDTGIADFAGSAPNTFTADFTVSERPLNATEAGTAKTNGRSFAYVPFAATPVAVATLVPSQPPFVPGGTINTSDLCPHINLSVADVGRVFGIDSVTPVNGWNDPRFTCSNGKALFSLGLLQGANADPTMANYAVMSLMDSDPTALGYFQAGLNSDFPLGKATTKDTTASEHWPYTGAYLIAGGDQPFINKLLKINATTNVPSTAASDWVLGAAFPVSSIWTGSPLGSPWNIPTAAVQNAFAAQTTFVPPSTESAAAAEADATLAKTSDPTTNNLVTFAPSTTDAKAYNNYLMEESYLVVPTNGLPADKASALASFIRYVLGPNGQRDITSFGVAAGATPAMVTAGLAVAGTLDAEAAHASTSSPSTSTTSTTVAGTASAASGSGSGAGAATGTSGGAGSSGGASSSPGLAFTGAPNLGFIITTGALLIVAGTVVRRRLRRRLAKL